jgi:hypothetical protein
MFCRPPLGRSGPQRHPRLLTSPQPAADPERPVCVVTARSEPSAICAGQRPNTHDRVPTTCGRSGKWVPTDDAGWRVGVVAVAVVAGVSDVAGVYLSDSVGYYASRTPQTRRHESSATRVEPGPVWGYSCSLHNRRGG